MSRKAVISTAVASIYREPSFSSEMVTQALMWEKVEILAEDKLWYQIRQKDGYTGWVYTFYLSKNSQSFDKWIILKDRFVPFSSGGGDNQKNRLLSFGTRVPVLEENTNYLTTILPSQIKGKIPIQELKEKKYRDQISKLSQSLMGTPYIWGGKSAFGFDCSGFIQLVLAVSGISISRDTQAQVETTWLNEINITESKPGDLVFFAENEQINHVGFSLGEGKIIHCSGEVNKESINEGDTGFNHWLSKSIFKTYSISGKVVG